FKDELVYVELQDIIRLEANSNYTKIYLSDSRSSIESKTLKLYEKILCSPQNHFMRVHQSHIVNLNCVIRYLKEEDGIIEMRDYTRIPLSRNRREDFFKWLGV
ncbi:MAG TPA: LytTR family DNA-binding domain-containing protein, partial [Bacteroidia bacterium]|nr:LytTR family DNA-binding domain-containing protein [Bacteroidia bacterium]